jgi:hypothetical protein
MGSRAWPGRGGHGQGASFVRRSDLVPKPKLYPRILFIYYILIPQYLVPNPTIM